MQIKASCTIIAALVAVQVEAQGFSECVGIDPAADGSITAMAKCIETLSLQGVALTQQRDAARAETVQLTNEIANINRILEQAVISFDRSERAGGACPAGWTLFKAAGGRFIVGAGQHENPGLSEYSSFADDPSEATGGAETVTLTNAQMPAHKHSLDLHLSNMAYRDPAIPNEAGEYPESILRISTGKPRNYRWTARNVEWINSAGEGVAHENLPPFIALYLCKKDSDR